METAYSNLNIEILMVLLIVASAVAVAVKWVKLPYSITLVIAGLLIGVFHLLPPVIMTPQLILAIFLPALLFEASWNLDLRLLKQNSLPIGILASFGVVLSMVTVAAVMHFWGGVNLNAALLFGAMISATDPISVLALFRKLGIDKRLSMILEGESLFNDGTAVVLFQLVLAATLAGTGFSPSAMMGDFLLVVIGGAVIGAMIGYAGSLITRYFDDHLLEITLTTIVAYGAYLLADQMHVSPVLAVVAAGILIGNYGSRTSMSATTRLAVNSFWEYAAFIANSLVFLLIGLQVKVNLLFQYSPLIGMGIVAIIFARLLVVYGLCPFLSSKAAPIPWKWRHLLYCGALRGSLSMALALSLPVNFPGREPIIITTFGVVLFTLLVQGLTIEPLVKLLRMIKTDLRLKEYWILKGELMVAGTALDSLNSLLKSHNVTAKAHAKLEAEILHEQEQLRYEIEQLHIADISLESLELKNARKFLLDIRKDRATQLAREGVILDEAAEHIKVSLDKQLEELRLALNQSALPEADRTQSTTMPDPGTETTNQPSEEKAELG